MSTKQKMGWWTRGLAVGAVVLCAQVAYGAIIIIASTAFVDGVDATGVREPANGAEGNCMISKNTETGYIFQYCQATVVNESGAIQVYANFGIEMTDPETDETVTSLVDILRVGATGRARQLSVAQNLVTEI